MGRFEDTSWLLFHDLINNRSDAFKRYQRRLGALEPSPQAWKAEFLDLDPAALETTLLEYSRSGKFNVGYRTIAPWERDVRIRSLSDAEVHGVRALLYSFFSPPGEKSDSRAAAAELEDAFRSERPPIEALALAFYEQGDSQGGTRAKLAQQAVAVHPDHLLAWLMLADSKTVADPAHRTALVRALARAPDNRDVLERLTFLTTHLLRWQDALVFSPRALDNGSVRNDVRLAHLLALAMTGRCAAAARWANVLGSLGPKQPKEFAPLWGRLKNACVPAPLQAPTAARPEERAVD